MTEISGAGNSAPYRPSAVNRLIGFVERRPGPFWLYYLVLWLFLFLALTVVKWFEGGFPWWSFHLQFADFTLWGIYILAAQHYLERYASQAFERLRPVLIDDEGERGRLHYQLVNQPAGPTLVAGLLGVLWGAWAFIWNPSYVTGRSLFVTPVATVFEVAILLLYGFISGVALYVIGHRLVVMVRIYRSCGEIDPFSSQPLYSLSALSVRTALAALFINYLFFLTTPAIATSEIIIWNTVAFSLLAVLLFLWPLWGAHSLLIEAKERLQGEINARVRTTFERLHEAVDANDLSGMEALSHSLSTLEKALQMVGRLSTWPWNPETPRLLASAIVLPIVIFVIQRLVERFLL